MINEKEEPEHSGGLGGSFILFEYFAAMVWVSWFAVTWIEHQFLEQHVHACMEN